MELSVIKELIIKYNQGTASEEERALVIEWYDRIEGDEVRFASGEFEALTAEVYANLKLHQQGRAVEQYDQQARPRLRVLKTVITAAAAVAAIAFGIWFFAYRELASLPGNQGAYASDIAPGKSGATITLASGEVIQLSDAKKGVIIANGKIAYSGSSLSIDQSSRGGTTKQSSDEIASLAGNDGKGNGEAQNLSASTAKGQTYEFTLPDGTHVWLNANSKLEFPSSFLNKKSRNVMLVGEGYFEVAKDKAHPFIVTTEDQQVKVLGTHFNLNTFGDEYEGTVTSLLEGAVKVSGREGSRILKPGERGVSTMKGILLLRGDAEEDIDWKNGDFVFDDESLEQIMKKVSRWYDIDVEYEAGIDKAQTFGGKVSRSKHISAVLKSMESTGKVRFKVAGRKVTVLK